MAACSQSLPATDYEVIVVDNASSDHTRAIATRFDRVRYLYCGTRGLSAARNTGAFGARSPFIAYIDDDAIASRTLLAELLHVYETNPKAGAVGGRIRLETPATLPRWFRKEFAGYYSAYDPGGDEIRRVTEMWEYPFGANISFRKESLEAAGYFSEKLGRIGRDQSGGEELDLQCRIAQRGDEIHYNPRASVDHVILPQRLTWTHIANTAKAAGRNWAYYEVELWKQKPRIRSDVRMLVGALARLHQREDRPVTHSQTIFYRAKILRKLRYRFLLH